MTIQYLTDIQGNKQSVQVLIPIKDWEKSGPQIVIEKKEEKKKPKFSKAKLKILNGIKEALEEVELHRQGKIKLKTLDELLDEL